MLTTTEKRAFQKKLEDMANRLKGDCSQLAGEGPPAPEAPADQPTVYQEGNVITGEAVTLTLLANEQRLFDEINAAKGRLENGTFGLCESCGEGITKIRLRALPYARYCTACAQVRELHHTT